MKHETDESGRLLPHPPPQAAVRGTRPQSRGMSCIPWLPLSVGGRAVGWHSDLCRGHTSETMASCTRCLMHFVACMVGPLSAKLTCPLQHGSHDIVDGGDGDLDGGAVGAGHRRAHQPFCPMLQSSSPWLPAFSWQWLGGRSICPPSWPLSTDICGHCLAPVAPYWTSAEF